MGNTEALARLAAAQHGVFAIHQATSARVGRMALGRMAARGEVHRVLPGVYAIGGADHFEAKLSAACLWAGKDAVVSHCAAAAVWRLDGFTRAAPPPEITISPGRRLSVQREVQVHRGDVPAEDRRAIRGIPVTTVARTIVDLAGSVDEETLAIALESAWHRKLAQLDWVERRMRETGGRGKPGMQALRRALRDCHRRRRPLESALEVRVWRLLREHKLPLPDPGLEFHDDEGHPCRIDFSYLAQRLAIEADGFETHGHREAFEKDRTRLSRLATAGWRVIHVTARHVKDQPERVVRWVARALGLVAPADD